MTNETPATPAPSNPAPQTAHAPSAGVADASTAGPAAASAPVRDVRAGLAQLRGRVGPAVGGADVAKRLRAFEDGTLYIDSTSSAAFVAWLVDAVLVNGMAIGLAVLYGMRSTDPYAAAGAGVIALALLVLLPLCYGWAYRNGRALGGLLTGTRLVRMKDGSRIGFAKAGWAMLIRTLLMPIAFWATLDGLSQVRVSIDDAATQRLRAAGFDRLPA
ncbi:RDD family protein [Microbacterium xylanilyticum]